MSSREFRRGLLAILPLAVGAGVYGFAFGVLAGQVGLAWWGVGGMSAAVFAGSSQIVAVEGLASGASVLGAVLAGAALNLRYLGIMASLAPVLADVSWGKRLLAMHLTADENWALTMARRAADPRIGADFLLGSGLSLFAVWVGSTALGALVGQAAPDLERFGLGFAFTAAFVAMARAVWRGTGDAVPFAVAFLVAAGAGRLGLATAYATVLGAALGVLVHALRRRVR